MSKGRRPLSIAGVLRQAWTERGWRRSTLLFSSTALLAFAANLAFSLWAVLAHPVSDGIGVIAEQECADISKLNAGIHVLINGLSTILLAGSNYCMQCLSSPTRSQVDKAHRKRRWMDIGVSSLRNIYSGEMTLRRGLLWFLLGASSLPLHLFYNSAVFQSISANAYRVWMVTEDWIDTGNTSSMTGATKASNELLEPLRTAISQGRLERLDTLACIDAYAVAFQSVRSDLVLVADGDGPHFGIMMNPNDARVVLDSVACGSHQAFQWMCRQYQPRYNGQNCETFCEQLVDTLRNDSRANNWRPFEGKPVRYCYSLPSAEHCKLQFSSSLLVTVVVLNLFKAVLMTCCAFGWKDEPPLLTVGDAIASFVQRPDDSTADMCLLPRDSNAAAMTWRAYSKYFVYRFDDQRQRKFKGASVQKRLVAIGCLLAAIAICLFLLVYGINQIKGTKDTATIFSMGLGTINSKTLMATRIAGQDSKTGLLSNVVLANTPQLVFSLIYFSYNGIFTTMSLANEWSSFADPSRGPKGLRRSGLIAGAQRSTYFLQLPYRIAIPLILVSGALHWLISQSIFLVYVEAYVADTSSYLTTVHRPNTNSVKDIITCGWSPSAVVSAVCVGVVMVVFLVWFGLRRLPTGMPVAGSCSATIAATCHPPSSEKNSIIWEKPLRWGETLAPSGGFPGHCSFSADEATYPIAGAQYF